MNTNEVPLSRPLEAVPNGAYRSACSLLAMIVVIALCSGCVTNGRRVLLKEYGPSVPVLTNASLQGSTVCIKGFTCAPDLISLELKTKPEEPSGFKYRDLTREQDKLWDKEMKELQKKTKETDWTKIGNMRNGFGMVMSHVYALNDPAAWLAEALKYDLEAQGAKVVDASQSSDADVSIAGIVQLFREDMYVTVNASFVIDLDVQPKQGEPRRRQIHTHGATGAMLASEGEYFHALRDARQKFSVLTIQEISRAIGKRNQAAGVASK